jgi:hypothetical protein
MQCSVVYPYKRFWGTFYLHQRGRRKKKLFTTNAMRTSNLILPSWWRYLSFSSGNPLHRDFTETCCLQRKFVFGKGQIWSTVISHCRLSVLSVGTAYKNCSFMYDLKFSQRQHALKSFQEHRHQCEVDAWNFWGCIYMFRGLCNECCVHTVSETLGINFTLARLIAREDFIIEIFYMWPE